MVYDVNSNAAPRLDELSTYYLPTAYFDGGLDVYVGGDPGGTTESYYNASILACSENIVADVSSSLSVMWLGEATIGIDISISTNESLVTVVTLEFMLQRLQPLMWNGLIPAMCHIHLHF